MSRMATHTAGKHGVAFSSGTQGRKPSVEAVRNLPGKGYF